MADGERGNKGRRRPGAGRAEEFAREVRWFAFDARLILDRPECGPDEAIELHRTIWYLLREPRVARSSAMRRRLLAVQRAVEDRLPSWSLEDLDSLVA